MSDRAALLIEQLADGPQTTDDLVEATGLERSAVSQELAGLKHAGTVHSGRGGWHLADRPPAKVKRHEAAESTAVEDKLAKDRARKAAKKAAKVAPPPAVPKRAVHNGSATYLFGLTEAGELTVSDPKDAAKMLRFSVSDTARLKGLMARWGSMIGDEEAA